MDREKTKSIEFDRDKREILRDQLNQLAACDEIVSDETVNVIGRVTEDVRGADANAPSSDELDEELEEQYQDLNYFLDLPDDTYSLTQIRPELPSCVRYGVRAGLTHINMPKFSPLSRGHQGGATAIAAFAATTIYKSRCWNEAVIDAIIEDGDTFYCQSYRNVNTDDRRLMSILDLQRTLCVQNRLTVNVSIEDAAYAGTFRSTEPTELHLVKALDLFFKRYTAGILCSSVLNIAIWKDPKYFNIFDGQARNESNEPDPDGIDGTAKLFLVKDLIGVLFIILEKSKVKNEPFVLYAISISGVDHYTQQKEVTEEGKELSKPQRRPSGYRIKEKYRAVIQGSYHIMHPAIPQPLRGRTDLILALAALVYSRLVNANKWTSALVDLIFNQVNIYFVDLVRVLDKKLDDPDFQLRLDDAMGDVILGVYSAKVKIRTNVVPGFGQQKGKQTMDEGIREFFDILPCGLLDIKQHFYAIWRHDDTYYFMDPYACDDEGFRSGTAELDGVAKPGESACVTMNSSVNQVIETIMENTGSREKDPFIIHGVRVLYVKTGSTPGGPLERVIYRERGANRRPQAPPPILKDDQKLDGVPMDMKPTIRPSVDKIRHISTQYPSLMKNAESYMMTDDEPTTYIVLPPEEEKEEELTGEELEEEEEEGIAPVPTEDEEELSEEEEGEGWPVVEEEKPPVVNVVKGYYVPNPNRLILLGSKNCLDKSFQPRSRGQQGLIAALTALAYRKLKDPMKWRNMDVDQMIDVANKTYDDVIDWIRKGRPEVKEPKEIAGEVEEEEEEAGGEEEEEEKKLLPIPSHLDMTMLPVRLKLGEHDVFFKTKMNIIQGEANPLANIAEALECYLNRYSELVIENKRLMYGIWKDEEGFYMFNPYGSDKEGWRLRDYPASFAVVASLNELVDLLYGVLEFNDPNFIIHFVGLNSIQPGMYTADEEVQVPEDAAIELFKTKFLPITDDDLTKLEEELRQQTEVLEEDEEIIETVADEEEEDEEEEEVEGEVLGEVEPEPEKPIIDPLLEIMEQEQPDAPYRLNLILLTSNMKILEEEEEDFGHVHEQLALERLKYNHPPPYVMPSSKTLIKLLEAKRAKRSIPSLVSRFSIDSRLDIKKKGGFQSMLASRSVLTTVQDGEYKPSKLIKLSAKKYLYSRLLPICLMPLRAINDMYIQNEELSRALNEEEATDKEDDMVPEILPEIPAGIRIQPELIPLGPLLKTPLPEKKYVNCIEKKKRKCLLAKGDVGDSIMEKLLCNTEDLLLELFFPNFKVKEQLYPEDKTVDDRGKGADKLSSERTSTIRSSHTNGEQKKGGSQDEPGFKVTPEKIGIIQGNMCLEDRVQIEPCHFKSCFFSALLCILTKIKLDANNFRPSTLDQLIFLGDKIYQKTGKLRYKPYRWFQQIEVADTVYNAITKQATYADPESCDDDDLETVMETFFEKNQTGIIVFSNSSYAFWTADNRYYLFDPYACDEKGDASEGGYSCLMEFCNLDDLIKKLETTVGENTKKPYRLYTVCIAHMETKKRKKKRKKKSVRCVEKPEPEPRVEETPELEVSTSSEASLIELTDWVKSESKTSLTHDMTIPGFAPIKYYNASMLDVIVVENEITTPILAPFTKSSQRQMLGLDVLDAIKLLVRRKVYDRRVKPHTAVASPLDLCVMAWSLIHDPATWSTRTVRGLFEAAIDYTFDSLLAAEDSTVTDMMDGLLPEFEIANYVFRVVFVPLHHGTLYTIEGWNLSMSLQRIFDTPSYTGAIIVCGTVHIGVTKKDGNYFAWWLILGKKIFRMITSVNLKEFLRLIVKQINQPEETVFVMRVITVSYAQKLDPDCSDTRGLHEPVIPTTSLPEIHRAPAEPYNLEAIFRPTVPDSKPIFIQGTVALSNRDTVREPLVKRCYFVAILAVMVKRDIIQSPMPEMIDKVIEVAETVYREFQDPKFHTQHILRNITVMNRIFDFHDCAEPLVPLTLNRRTMRTDYYLQVKKHVKKHLKTNASGILQFTNCCYGFWYSRGTNAYYYIDPYQCNERGRKVSRGGRACLCIFPSVCQMVKQMCMNQYEDTTGFFVHTLHVDSINVPPFKTFKEDPMWLYLDYHWTVRHAPDFVKTTNKKKKAEEEEEEQGVKQFWNNYAIEVTNLIYSAWGTIGSYDSRFGDRAGKNQTAVCVAVLAMQYLSHPSRWGPAVLDSAVICGDSYYTESLRSSIQKCAKYPNKFNLQPCFKIFPHLWIIDFRESTCGVLYGARNRLTLTAALKIALDDSPNVLLECNRITLALIAAKDGYYVADPCWVGPPLFFKDHGAIYVLRCRNMNCLVYAVIKMLNTNQRIDFRLTPIAFTFEQEDFNFMDNKEQGKSTKKILLEPIRTSPGKAEEPGVAVPGAVAAPDGDSYLQYRKNISMGLRRGPALENPELPSVEPMLHKENETSMNVSTTWHLNFGQARPLQKVEPVFDPKLIQHKPADCEERVINSFEPREAVQMSITDLLAACDDYPRVLDFKSEDFKPERPLECAPAESFLTDAARKEFRNWTNDMARKVYKSYKHRLPKPKPKIMSDDVITEEEMTDGDATEYEGETDGTEEAEGGEDVGEATEEED